MYTMYLNLSIDFYLLGMLWWVIFVLAAYHFKSVNKSLLWKLLLTSPLYPLALIYMIWIDIK